MTWLLIVVMYFYTTISPKIITNLSTLSSLLFMGVICHWMPEVFREVHPEPQQHLWEVKFPIIRGVNRLSIIRNSIEKRLWIDTVDNRKLS